MRKLRLTCQVIPLCGELTYLRNPPSQQSEWTYGESNPGLVNANDALNHSTIGPMLSAGTVRMRRCTV